uniref:Protein kinase domain-containing protein n=1 Tax=Caenorhabditis tropicalis TaxID=1561998 RepID=A0A1I7TCC9_9PELO
MDDPPPPPVPSTPPAAQNGPRIVGTPPAAVAVPIPIPPANGALVAVIPQAIPVEKDRLPKEGDEIITDAGKKYKLGPVLGDGGYGTVFQSQDDDIKIAVKTEKFSKSQLKIEIIVLKAAMQANCKHFCELIDCGTKLKDFDYMMITLLGKDLHKLRCELPERKFSINTALRVGIQTLKACEELHRIGFVSRDVKPGNFAPGVKANRQSRTIFMYDFGLARRYVDKNNQIIPSRKEVGWRGTTRYGSLNAHKRQDLGRRDDLESWFYGLVEMTRGTLPWRNVVERNHVQKAKEASRLAGRTQFLFETPTQYDKIFTLIDSYTFESAPDYKQINKYLVEAREERQLRDREHWDWEDETVSTTLTTITSFSDKELRAKAEQQYVISIH